MAPMLRRYFATREVTINGRTYEEGDEVMLNEVDARREMEVGSIREAPAGDQATGQTTTATGDETQMPETQEVYQKPAEEVHKDEKGQMRTGPKRKTTR